MRDNEYAIQTYNNVFTIIKIKIVRGTLSKKNECYRKLWNIKSGKGELKKNHCY